MKKQRKYREFTPAELETIKTYSGKISIMELSGIMEINYTNLSSALKQWRVPFVSKKAAPNNPVKKIDSALLKKTNTKGEEILTDEMMKEYAYM